MRFGGSSAGLGIETPFDGCIALEKRSLLSPQTAMPALRDRLPGEGAIRASKSDSLRVTSSGGTHAGLLAGASIVESSTWIVGIEVDKRGADEHPFDAFIASLASQTAELLGAGALY